MTGTINANETLNGGVEAIPTLSGTLSGNTTSSYNSLSDKPIINGTTLEGGVDRSLVEDVKVNGVSVVTDHVAEIENSAEDISYDNSDSQAQSTNVQDALDEAFERTVALANAFSDISDSYAQTYYILRGYSVGDYVLKDRTLYKCISPVASGGEAWNPDKWEEVKLADEIKEVKEDLAEEKETVEDNLYVKGKIENKSIATFTDGSDLPLASLKTTIVPIQSGSGDPSPSNVRPISGWSGANVTVTNDNLLGGLPLAKEFEGAVGYTIDTTNKTFTFQRSKAEWTPNVKFKENTRYTFIFTYSGGSNNCLRIKYIDGTSYSFVFNSSEKTILLVTSSKNKTIRGLDIGYFVTDTVTIYYEESGLFEGELTASDFEPYNGQTYNIPFQDSQGNPIEVFGGELDVVSGTSGNKKTLGKIIVDENTNIKAYGGWRFYFDVPNFVSPANNVVANIRCDKLATRTKNSMPQGNSISAYDESGARMIIAVNSTIATVEDMKAWLTNNPLEIVYELATTSTFTSQPTSIKSLEGSNNVWADCGNIKDLKYVRNLNITINDLISRVETLEG